MSIEAMIAAIAGSGIGGIVAGGVAVYALMRGSVYAWRERGDLFKQQLADEKAARANDATAHQDELADAHAVKIADEERMRAVVRGRDLRIAQLEKVLHDHADVPSIRARLDGLGLLPVVQGPDAPAGDPHRPDPVQPATAPTLDIIEDLK